MDAQDILTLEMMLATTPMSFTQRLAIENILDYCKNTHFGWYPTLEQLHEMNQMKGITPVTNIYLEKSDS